MSHARSPRGRGIEPRGVLPIRPPHATPFAVRFSRAACVAALCVWASTSLAAHAQSGAAPLDAAERNTLELVALGKARSEMLERVRALALGADMTVGRWASGAIDSDRALRAWGRSRPRWGVPRHYSDNVCEVDLRLEPDEIRDALLQLLAEHPPAKPPMDERTIRAAAREWKTLWATGVATPPEVKYPGRPAGWEDITSEGIELARAAATADANAALLDEAGRLKVTAARRLREFLESSDAVRDAVREALLKQANTNVAFEPDQVAVATAKIAMRDLLRIVTEAHAAKYQGDAFAAADFREMLLNERRETLEATGLAPPPARTVMRNPYAEIEKDVPEWVGRTLTATGRFISDAGATADDAALADAARLDAVDQLRRQVQKLVIQKNVTVEQFVGYHEKLKDDVVLCLTAARPVGAARKIDGGVEATVELPLRRLWEIVRRAMTLEEVDPEPTTRPASP